VNEPLGYNYFMRAISSDCLNSCNECMHDYLSDEVLVDCSLNVMAHGDAREGKWRRNWRMDWVASTLHTTSEHGVSSITTADAHISAASSRLNCRFKWTRPFRRKTKSGFCACSITFRKQYTTIYLPSHIIYWFYMNIPIIVAMMDIT